MKRFFALSVISVFMLLWGCTQGEFPQDTHVATTTDATIITSPPVYWRNWPSAFRDNRRDTYTRIEIEGSDLFQSSEGSLVVGYYENKELKIIILTIYQSRHQVILRFYPFGDVVVMLEEIIRYASDKPLPEITEDDMRLAAVSQMVIKEGKEYSFIDDHEPMYASDNTWYAEIYAKAVEALEETGTLS